MKLLYLPRYERLGASSRLRFYQYVSYLQNQGLEFSAAPLLSDAYIKKMYAGRLRWKEIFNGYWRRFCNLLYLKNFDAVWLEKEFLPWIPAWIELSLLPNRTKLIVDYDDAVFHQYDQHRYFIVRWLLGNKIDAVMHRANLVVAGNSYLAERARQAGANWIEILPTVVDTSNYSVAPKEQNREVTIGWIGSPATAHFLRLIALVLNELAQNKNVRFVAVGANADQLVDLPVSAEPWTEDREVDLIQQFDIGIMPLPDEPFERGKCGYKLIQSMACGKPVVASPVGANSEIVRDGVNGFLATSQTDWVAALTKLINDPSLRLKMGNAGREQIESQYSLHTAGPRLYGLFQSLLESAN